MNVCTSFLDNVIRLYHDREQIGFRVPVPPAFQPLSPGLLSLDLNGRGALCLIKRRTFNRDTVRVPVVRRLCNTDGFQRQIDPRLLFCGFF